MTAIKGKKRVETENTYFALRPRISRIFFRVSPLFGRYSVYLFRPRYSNYRVHVQQSSLKKNHFFHYYFFFFINPNVISTYVVCGHTTRFSILVSIKTQKKKRNLTDKVFTRKRSRTLTEYKCLRLLTIWKQINFFFFLYNSYMHCLWHKYCRTWIVFELRSNNNCIYYVPITIL